VIFYKAEDPMSRVTHLVLGTICTPWKKCTCIASSEDGELRTVGQTVGIS
jgi:hypothetical protein